MTNKKKVTRFNPTNDMRQRIATEIKDHAVNDDKNFVSTQVVRNIVRRIADQAGLEMPNNRQIGQVLNTMSEKDLVYIFRCVPSGPTHPAGIIPFYLTTWGKVMADKQRKVKQDRVEAKPAPADTIGKDSEPKNKYGNNIKEALIRRQKELSAQLFEVKTLLINIEEAETFIQTNLL